MITVQLYGKNIANSRIKADVKVAPVTTSDNVFLEDGSTLTEKLKEIEDIKKELEALKKRKISKE